MTTNCPICGTFPCYAICPTQDPYQGNQEAEDRDFFPEDLDELQARHECERYAKHECQCDMEDDGDTP